MQLRTFPPYSGLLREQGYTLSLNKKSGPHFTPRATRRLCATMRVSIPSRVTIFWSRLLYLWRRSGWALIDRWLTATRREGGVMHGRCRDLRLACVFAFRPPCFACSTGSVASVIANFLTVALGSISCGSFGVSRSCNRFLHLGDRNASLGNETSRIE